MDTIDCDDLDDDDEIGIRAVEELLTDFMQMAHIMIENVIPVDTNAPGDADEDGLDPNNATIHSGDLDTKSGGGGEEKKPMTKKPTGLSQFMAVLTTMQSTGMDRSRDNEDSSSVSSQEDSDEPFVLKIDEYPVPLQLVYHLLLRCVLIC